LARFGFWFKSTAVTNGKPKRKSVYTARAHNNNWTCTLEDDKTVEDVQAVNSKWLAYVHANVSEEIRSSVVTAVVGNLEGFIFVDSYPDLDTWTPGQRRNPDWIRMSPTK